MEALALSYLEQAWFINIPPFLALPNSKLPSPQKKRKKKGGVCH